MTALQPLQMLVVGAGAMGRAWLATLRDDPRWQLAALVDPGLDALHGAAEMFGLPPERRFATLDAALTQSSADAVLVVSPPDAHRAACEAALGRGLPVLCEKPLAGTLRDGVAVVEAARRSGALLMVGQGRRWLPHIAAMREAVHAGLIGPLGYISCQFRIPFRFGGWREAMPEVLIEDMTIHHLDSIRYITGREGLRVFAHSFRPAWSWYAGNPCATLDLLLEGELPVSYSGSWVARGPRSSWDGELLLVGAEGALHLREDESVWHYRGEAETPEPLALPTFTPGGLARGLEIFTRALAGEAAPLPDGEDALLSLALTSAAVASAHAGQPVDVPAHLRAAGWSAR